MAKHEQSVADGFNSYMRELGERLGKKFQPFSLDGQDRDAGADYLITASSQFALIEFKYSLSEIKQEKDKPRRLTLCEKLQTNHDMRGRHDKCHFITWLHPPELEMKSNIYRLEVCNSSIFGPQCGLTSKSPDSATRVSANTFGNEFFNAGSKRSIALNEFEIYLDWLLSDASSSSKSTLELACLDESSGSSFFKIFTSVREAHEWLLLHKPKPARKAKRRPGI